MLVNKKIKRYISVDRIEIIECYLMFQKKIISKTCHTIWNWDTLMKTNIFTLGVNIKQNFRLSISNMKKKCGKFLKKIALNF